MEPSARLPVVSRNCRWRSCAAESLSSASGTSALLAYDRATRRSSAGICSSTMFVSRIKSCSADDLTPGLLSSCELCDARLRGVDDPCTSSEFAELLLEPPSIAAALFGDLGDVGKRSSIIKDPGMVAAAAAVDDNGAALPASTQLALAESRPDIASSFTCSEMCRKTSISGSGRRNCWRSADTSRSTESADDGMYSSARSAAESPG
mmetsp:Transcript_10565/g.28114  ORF Transcript_10565/g.28114 Transcript_10565/m.28114 type:complete len:207 (+) Transcript_10565:2043-2663(+)